jgi:hypothetical protein
VARDRSRLTGVALIAISATSFGALAIFARIAYAPAPMCSRRRPCPPS